MSELKVAALPDPEPFNDVRLLLPVINTKAEKTQAKSNDGALGGSLRQPQQPGGGGGGNDQKRASRGAPPLPSLNSQPIPTPPDIIQSTLVIRPTVFVDPNSLPRMRGPVGMPDGQIEAPSRGPGKGNGIGPGVGPGYGLGNGGNVGGKYLRIGGGATDGCCGDVSVMGPNLKPTILYREKAKYTEEARQNRVQGTVTLNVVFGADGQIHNIRTVRGLSHGLTETAIEAAQRIRFQPAARDGKAVSVSATLEFNFALY
jgi:TonB family protein